MYSPFTFELIDIEILLPPSRSSHRDASKHIHVDQKMSRSKFHLRSIGHNAKVGFDLEMSNLSLFVGERRNRSGRWAQYLNSSRTLRTKEVFHVATLQLQTGDLT